MAGQVFHDPTPTWMRPSVVTGRTQGEASPYEPTVWKAIRMLAGLIGADDPQSQAMGAATTGVPVKNAVADAVSRLSGKVPIKAYHGSPHDFDKFSSAKIGTGEGAHAYGHGLYFAENEATAEAYRKSLSRHVTPPEVRDSGLPGGLFAINRDRVRRGLDPVRPGKTYEVNIHADPESLLDWDAPLSQQSEKVRQWVATDPVAQRRIASASGEHTGSTLYRSLADAGANERLKQAGIPGIKYLDQGSRIAGEGTRNYVMFDDSLIDILRKWGLLPAAVGTGAMSQPAEEAPK